MFRNVLCAIVAISFVPCDVRAQAPPKTGSADLKAMYEDIEILRRLLANELASTPARSTGEFLYGHNDAVRRGVDWLSSYQSRLNMDAVSGAAFYNDTLHWTIKRPATAALEGAYLKGHGVSYTLTIGSADHAVFDPHTKGMGLLSICIKCHAADSADRYLNPSVPNRTPPKLSDWDRTRKEIRGEKDEPQPSIADSFKIQGICAPGNLTEKILKVLAENGHNFKQLPGTESITVVITFPAPRAESGDGSRKATFVPATIRAAEEAIARGDLQFKENRYAEAITHYLAAITHLGYPITFPTDAPYGAARQVVDDAQKLLRSAYTKQAQAFLAAGKTAEAKDALTKAESVKLQVNLPKEKPEPKVSSSQPGKLLITVSKKVLDQHKEGKLTLDQFRKEAEVQAINLPPAEKAKP